jgi:hypothetical protein
MYFIIFSLIAFLFACTALLDRVHGSKRLALEWAAAGGFAILMAALTSFAI